MVENKTKVGVTAGASAPESWFEKSCKPFKTGDTRPYAKGEGAEESIVFVLPKELRREGENKQILNKGKFVICFI